MPCVTKFMANQFITIPWSVSNCTPNSILLRISIQSKCSSKLVLIILFGNLIEQLQQKWIKWICFVNHFGIFFCFFFLYFWCHRRTLYFLGLKNAMLFNVFVVWYNVPQSETQTCIEAFFYQIWKLKACLDSHWPSAKSQIQKKLPISLQCY